MIDVRIYLAPGARMPTRALPGDAGLDLYAPDGEDACRVYLGATYPTLVSTGVHVEIPHGYVGHVLPRSSVTMRGIFVAHGVIDAGYRGAIGVMMWSPTTAIVKPGERIAQLVIAPCWVGTPVAVATLAELGETARGAGGFGSTGSR